MVLRVTAHYYFCTQFNQEPQYLDMDRLDGAGDSAGEGVLHLHRLNHCALLPLSNLNMVMAMAMETFRLYYLVSYFDGDTPNNSWQRRYLDYTTLSPTLTEILLTTPGKGDI